MRDYKFLLISRPVIIAFLSIYMVFDSGGAHALPVLQLDNVSNSYSSCNFQDNSDGTTTLMTTIDFNDIEGHNGTIKGGNRGLLIYNYDKYGTPSSNVITNHERIVINGVPSYSGYSGKDRGAHYVMYAFDYRYLPKVAFTANVVVVVPTAALSQWPAISIRAATYGGGFQDDVGEIKGAAYISRDRNGNGDASCRVIIEPGTPPPLDTNITVTAPDWDLGELQQGQSDTIFSRLEQQLCFGYSQVEVQGEKFIINASSANGVVNGRYRLRHLSDASQTIPYSLTLNYGSTRLQLPNNSTAIPLGGSMRTCFYPIFRTEVGKNVKGGDYSDVLTFTITTKA